MAKAGGARLSIACAAALAAGAAAVAVLLAALARHAPRGA